MDRTEAFQTLGIECTKDERAIKSAYRERLAVTNPEDDPEGFKELRAAYEEACRYARESGEVKESGKLRDTTPSGLWMEKAEAVYADIRARQDVDLWKQLFDEDVFVSLEEEENCRLKLLGFLAEHYRLPTAVWKLLDKKLSITADNAALREKFPGDFVSYIVEKCRRGEDVDFSFFEGPQDADYDLFFRYYEKCWQALQEGKTEEAGKCLERVDALGISHPVTEICRANYLRRQGKPEEAAEILEEQWRKHPGDVLIGNNLAEFLWNTGREREPVREAYVERAAEIYQELKETNDRHYIANLRLAEWYCDKGRYREAKKCAEKVLVAGGSDAFMEVLGRINAEIEKELEAAYQKDGGWQEALELCWCYLQDGKIARGIRLARRIEKQLPPQKEAEYFGLMAKLYAEEAEYEDSVFMTHRWQEALEERIPTLEEGEEKEKDLDRCVQARLIRVQCYHNLGYRDRENFLLAIEEAKKLLGDTVDRDVGILLELTQLYMEAGEYDQGLELVQRLLTEHQVLAAHAIALEIYRRQLDAGGVLRAGSRCLEIFPGYLKAYEYMAKVYLDLKQTGELQKLLDGAEKAGVKSVVLDAYRFQMNHKPMEVVALELKLNSFYKRYRDRLDDGQEASYEKGLEIITEYLLHYPVSSILIDRAGFQSAAHHYEEAREDLEKALALDPAGALALSGLSAVYRCLGDYEKALIFINRAILYREKGMSAQGYLDRGNLYALLGDFRMALASYKQYFLESGKQKTALERNRVLFHAQLGEYDRAAEICEAAFGKGADYYERLTELYVKGGEEERARESLGRWAAYLKVNRFGPRWAGVWRTLFPGSVQVFRASLELAAYFRYAGWAELIFGKRETALKAFRKMALCMRDGDLGVEEKLGEIVFACILCGEEAWGGKCAERLQIWLNRHSFEGRNTYHNRRRALVQLEFLAKYYRASDGALEEILDGGEKLEICGGCVCPVCSRLTGARLLLLLRKGEREKTLDLIGKSLETQPWDNYVRAVKHMAF